MAVQTILIAAAAVIYFLVRYMNRTDVPKIKGIPEIPGVPLFGNLLQLGTQHAVVARKWAKSFGPVFQVRMGNKVRKMRSEIPSIAVPVPDPPTFLLLSSALFSPTASTRSASSGSKTSPPSSRVPPSTLSTASYPPRRASPSVPLPGMNPASVVARPLRPR